MYRSAASGFGRTCILTASVVLLGACRSAPAPSAPSPSPYGEENFRIYRGTGAQASMRDLLDAMREVDVVLVGEEHDDSVGHLVEYAILGAAYRAVAEPAGRPTVLSLEMFERDVQGVVDEYLDGLITEDHFKASSRPWDRYETDYRRLVEFARGNGIRVVAANAPRRYVNRVSRLGPQALQDLSPEARAFLPPLPYPEPSERYRAQWDSLMAESMPSRPSGGEGRAPDHRWGGAGEGMPSMSNVLYAQALWDAAMGEAVVRALDEHPGALVIHFAGVFHVERGTGIPEAIPAYRPGTRILTVAMRPAEDIAAFNAEEHSGLGDFVILTHKPRQRDD